MQGTLVRGGIDRLDLEIFRCTVQRDARAPGGI
jgi:hypothetical protein